jgi:hypothetical protein
MATTLPDNHHASISGMMVDIIRKIRQIIDNGGRRWTRADRRLYDYTACIPERRTGMDRRSGNDRRKVDALP